MGQRGASCFHTISPSERDLNKEEWDRERFGMVCTKSENFSSWQKAILKLCDTSNICNYEVIETLNALAEKAAIYGQQQPNER
jgi:hypothetical protein